MARSPAKNYSTTLRLDNAGYMRLTEMLRENPLYTNSRVMRGALLALSMLSEREREACIMAAARGGADEL